MLHKVLYMFFLPTFVLLPVFSSCSMGFSQRAYFVTTNIHPKNNNNKTTKLTQQNNKTRAKEKVDINSLDCYCNVHVYTIVMVIHHPHRSTRPNMAEEFTQTAQRE